MAITKAPKLLLGVGFIFSAITTGSIGSLFLAFIALYTYLIGVVLRGAGWIVLGRSFSKLYVVTGIIVLLFGIGVLSSFLMENISMMILLWSIYTLMEFYSYFTLRKISKLFIGAMISILGLIIVDISLINVQDIQKISEGGSPLIFIGFWILAISALLAAIGSFTMKPQQKEIEAEKTGEETEKAI